MPKPPPPLEPVAFEMAIDAMCRPRLRQASQVKGLDLNSASRKRSGAVAMLMRERDKMLQEMDSLEHKISGLNLAIEILEKAP